MFAEFLAPALNVAEAVLNTPLPVDPKAKLELAKRKLAAAELVPAMRVALYPADDDG